MREITARWGAARGRQHIVVLGVVGMTAALAACGQGGSATDDHEGVVVYYSGRSEQGLDAFEEAFETAHPDIDLQVIKGSNDDLAARILTEAGRQQADVTELGAAYMAQVRDAGILAPIETSIVDALPESSVGPDNLYVATRYSSHVIPYATQLVDEEHIPANHEDFLDPYWKGKFAIATGDVEWAFKEYVTRGPDGAREFFQQIMAQQPQILDQGRGSIAELVASGQLAASTTTQVHNLQPRIDSGLPIGGTPFDPPVILVDYIAVFNEAPHPEATKIFIEWLYSEDGFATDAELGQARIGDEASLELLSDPDAILLDPGNLAEQAEATAIFTEEILGK